MVDRFRGALHLQSTVQHNRMGAGVSSMDNCEGSTVE